MIIQGKIKGILLSGLILLILCVALTIVIIAEAEMALTVFNEFFAEDNIKTELKLYDINSEYMRFKIQAVETQKAWIDNYTKEVIEDAMP